MQNKYKILMGTNEQGGAECLAPVAKHLLAAGHDVLLYSGKSCAAIFTRSNLKCTIVHDTAPDMQEWASAILQSEANVVVTGILGKKTNLDYTLIQAAKSLQVPTVCLLDSWLQYRDRLFDSHHPSDVYWPTKLTVMDESSCEELKKIEFPADRIVVTGHPKFDELFGLKKKRTDAKARQNLKRKYGLPAEESVLVFFSQPLSKYYSKLELGYDEYDVVNMLFASYLKLPNPKVGLIIKEHPLKPTLARTEEYLPPGVQILKSGDTDELLVLSDVVLGMSTTVLVHAALLEIPVLNIQPHVQRDFNSLTQSGIFKNIATATELTQQLSAMLSNKKYQSPPMGALLDGHVCERITKTLITLIESGEGSKHNVD